MSDKILTAAGKLQEENERLRDENAALKHDLAKAYDTISVERAVSDRLLEALQACYECLTGEYDTDRAHQRAMTLADRAIAEFEAMRKEKE